MKKRSDWNYQTLKQAGYKYIWSLGNGEHLLSNEGGKFEVWANNKNGSGYRLIYKNTHLEFCREGGGINAGRTGHSI